MKSRYLTFTLLVLGCVLWALPAAGAGVLNPDIVVRVEEPAHGTTYSGVANVRGYAVAPAGIKRVELEVDGIFVTNIPSGGLREDVAAAYPGFPDSEHSGFSMAYNYSELGDGAHTLTVTAVDGNDDYQERTAAFNVVCFPNPFIVDPTAVTLGTATVAKTGDSILVQQMTVEGENCDIRMDWRRSMQGYAITSVDCEEPPPPPPPPPDARWGVLTAMCCSTSPLTLTVTIEGVARSSVAQSCVADPTWEGFVSTSPGSKSFRSRLSSQTCPTLDLTGTADLVSGSCHLFVAAIQDNQPVLLMAEGPDVCSFDGTVLAATAAQASEASKLPLRSAVTDGTRGGLDPFRPLSRP